MHLRPICGLPIVILTASFAFWSCGALEDESKDDDGGLEFSDTPVAGKVNGESFKLGTAKVILEVDDEGEDQFRYQWMGQTIDHVCFREVDFKEGPYVTHIGPIVVGEYSLEPFSLETKVFANFVHLVEGETGPLNKIVSNGKVSVDSITETHVTGKIVFAAPNDPNYLINGTFKATKCQTVDIKTSATAHEFLPKVLTTLTGEEGKTFVGIPSVGGDAQGFYMYDLNEGVFAVGGQLRFDRLSQTIGSYKQVSKEITILTPMGTCPDESPQKETCALVLAANKLALANLGKSIPVNLNLTENKDAAEVTPLTAQVQVLLDHHDKLLALATKKKLTVVDINFTKSGSHLSGTELQLTVSDETSPEALLKLLSE
jgi:hypothetical protein